MGGIALKFFTTSSNKKPDEDRSEESVTSLHSWTQKNEQMISSISGRLAVVETRLSLVAPISDLESREASQGPIQRLVTEVKRPVNVRAWARVLDHDLALLQEKMQNQDQELKLLTNQLAGFTGTTDDAKTLHENMKKQVDQSTQELIERLDRLEQQRGRLVTMRLGRFEVPLELSSILFGGLAFTVATLIVVGQKQVLVDPAFLAGIGIVFLSSTVIKHLFGKTRGSMSSALRESMPLPETNSLEDHA
jgi:hypothetical protein